MGTMKGLWKAIESTPTETYEIHPLGGLEDLKWWHTLKGLKRWELRCFHRPQRLNHARKKFQDVSITGFLSTDGRNGQLTKQITRRLQACQWQH